MTVPQRVLDTMNSGLIYTCDDEEMIKAQKEQMEPSMQPAPVK